MIRKYKYPSPFETLISFHKLIEGLEQLELSETDYKSAYAKDLLNQIKDKPELVSGIENIDIIENNKDLIKNILSELFPKALTFNEIKAITLPFYDYTFNHTERLKNILEGAVIPFDINIRDMDEHQFYIMNCTIILNAHYKQNLDFGKPLFYDIPDKNGIIKHYKILYNADFLEIYPTDKTNFLSQTDIEELIDNYDNLALWKKAFPENSWLIKGFVIMSLVDVTTESAVSNMKSLLLKSDIENSKFNEEIISVFRSVFKIPDLKIGFTVYDDSEELFMKIPVDDRKLGSFLLLDANQADFKNAFCGYFDERILEKKDTIIITDVLEFTSKDENREFGEHLLKQNIHSFLLSPVIKENKLLGLIELASSKPRALNTINANKLDLIIPYLIDTIENSNNDMQNQFEVIIQKEYTSIHPSVYWKFRKEARDYFYSNIALKDYTFKEIVFKEVFPLYGQIDIKGSSEHRNEAIKSDLSVQLGLLNEIFENLNLDGRMLIIEQKIFEIQGFLEELNNPLKTETEQQIQKFVEYDVHPFLLKAKDNSNCSNKIEKYFENLDDKSGMYYQTRKDFDSTLSVINKKMAAILDARQVEAQNIFPHYYERFKTDGVEHNLYIGASINPNLNFDKVYLNNLRLWQLQTLCEMEIEHQKIKNTLPYPLEVTSLILVFSSPISIRFRMDEKRFDVDGSYNARYEVVKKRIDKANIKGTNERIIEKEKLTIVYSQNQEQAEYLKYIKFLQHKHILEPTIEQFDIEDLQGISGLKALRVKVIN